MIHYYDPTNLKKNPSTRTYCGLNVRKLSYSSHESADYQVLSADLRDDMYMCPECSKHPKIQMQILELVEI